MNTVYNIVGADFGAVATQLFNHQCWNKFENIAIDGLEVSKRVVRVSYSILYIPSDIHKSKGQKVS